MTKKIDLRVSTFIIAEKVLMAEIVLKGGDRNFFYSFIGPVGYNIRWEKR